MLIGVRLKFINTVIRVLALVFAPKFYCNEDFCDVVDQNYYYYYFTIKMIKLKQKNNTEDRKGNNYVLI